MRITVRLLCFHSKEGYLLFYRSALLPPEADSPLAKAVWGKPRATPSRSLEATHSGCGVSRQREARSGHGSPVLKSGESEGFALAQPDTLGLASGLRIPPPGGAQTVFPHPAGVRLIYGVALSSRATREKPTFLA